MIEPNMAAAAQQNIVNAKNCTKALKECKVLPLSTILQTRIKTFLKTVIRFCRKVFIWD